MKKSENSLPRIPDDPLMTIEINEPGIGLEGWVCVHALGKEGSSGGIRCVGDVSKEEVRLLARAMTYKYAFFGIPQGGAKAGLRLDYDVEPRRKAEIIRAAARHLEPLIRRSNIWSPWTDMNFYGEDLSNFYAEIGREYTPNPHYNSSHRTAISAFWSLEACLGFYDLDPRETRLTLEGFGSVTSYLSPYLMRLGTKVVAVSTHRGTVVNFGGLDLAAIVQLRKRYGSAWIDQAGDWQCLEREALFDIQTDILIPCARVHSIGAEQAERIPARLILPIANVPCTPEALEVFDQRGLDYLPDFVVNGGGISGHIREISDPFGALFKPMLHRLLTTAHRRGRPVRTVAENAAHANYGRIASLAYQGEPVTVKALKRLAPKGRLRNTIMKKLQDENLNRICMNMQGLFPISG